MDDKKYKANRRNFPNIVVNQVSVITNDSNTNQQEFNHHHVETNQTGNNVANVVINVDITAEDVDEEVSDDSSGEYCDYKCIHYREEYLDDGGGLVAEATGNVDRYCDLGYSLGGFCEDYE